MLSFEPPSALYRRPRLLNPLHALGLAKAHTQTNADELDCLRRHATQRTRALEIGSYMGASAAIIAKALVDDGQLFCVDPWEPRRGRENPGLTICRRELARNGVLDRVVFIRAYSQNITTELAGRFDFIFVDGDHSYQGLQTDWEIVLKRLAPNGVVCLHDTTVPASEPHRRPDSVAFFNDVIREHSEFEVLECCHTLNALLRRVASVP